MPAHSDPNTLSTNMNSSFGTWREAFLAGIPHLLVGLVSALSATLPAMGMKLPVIRINSTGAYLGILDLALAGVLFVSVVSILVYSSRRLRSGGPAGRWTASWYGYGFLLVSAALLVALQAWRTPFLGGRLTEAVMYIGLPLAWACLLFWLARLDPLKELLAALPVAAALWLPVLEFVPNSVRAPVTLGAWLLVALAAALIVRFGEVRLGTWLAAGASLLVGLAFSAARASFDILPSGNTYQAVPTRLDLGQVSYFFTPNLLATSTLLFGPILVWELWQFGRRGDGPGVWSYRLAVAGLALALVANLASFWWLTNGYLVPPAEFTYASLRLAFASAVYLGLLLFLAGALSFGVPTLWDRPVHNQAAFLLLLLFMLSLPFTAMMPAAFGSRITLPGLPLALSDLGEGQKLLAAIFALAWVFLASWLAARLARKGPFLGTL